MWQRARCFCYVTIIEVVRFLVDAIFQRDYPVGQDVHMLIAWFMLLGHLLVDVAYISLNLHVRSQSIVGLMARGAITRKGCRRKASWVELVTTLAYPWGMGIIAPAVMQPFGDLQQSETAMGTGAFLLER